MMISNSTFAHWLWVMDTPDGAEEATETRNAWHVISKDFSTGTPNDLLAALENTPMAAILIPVMREESIQPFLAHHICRLTLPSVPVTDLCEFFAIFGVNATPLQPKPQIIQIRPNWFDQEEDVVVTPSFNRLVDAITDDELSKLNTLDLEYLLSLNKSFKPRKVMPIPPNVAATIGRYKPSEFGQVFSACAQEIINTSTNNSSDDCGIQREILNSSDEVEKESSTDRARAYLPILQFIWPFLKGTKQSTPYVETDSMKISADPRVINKLSRIERCFLSDSSAPAAAGPPLAPLPPANVSSILQMMASSNSENSQATRELLAQLVEGHAKLSTEGSSRAKFWTPLPEFIQKLILAASVSALDSVIPMEPNEEYKVFFESPKQHNQSILLANALLGGSRSLPLLIDQQLADTLYNGQLQGFNDHKPGSLSLFHTAQSDNLSVTQLELELRLSSSTGLTDAKIEKLVKRTLRVAHDIPYLRAQLVNFLGGIDFLFTKELFLYLKVAILIPFIDRNLIQMSRTHLQDPKFIAPLSTIIDRKFQGFLSHCTNALTADDVRKFAFNFEHYCECISFGTTMSVTLAPEVAFCIAKPPTPKSGSRSEKRKADDGTTPPPKRVKLSKPLKNTRQVDEWKTDTAGLRKLREDMQNVPLFSTAPKCQVCVNFHSQGVCNANDACRFKASHGPLPTAVHQAYNTWQKDNRATA